MTPAEAIAQLEALADPGKAAEMARYHKVARSYLGAANPALDGLAKDWRAVLDVEQRVAVSAALWRTERSRGARSGRKTADTGATAPQ